MEWFQPGPPLGGYLGFEFVCDHCESVTIFKEINIAKKYLLCANCERQFVSKNLVRFDRTDRSSLGILLSPDTAISERLHTLTNDVRELTERFERLEILVLDDHALKKDYSVEN